MGSQQDAAKRPAYRLPPWAALSHYLASPLIQLQLEKSQTGATFALSYCSLPDVLPTMFWFVTSAAWYTSASSIPKRRKTYWSCRRYTSSLHMVTNSKRRYISHHNRITYSTFPVCLIIVDRGAATAMVIMRPQPVKLTYNTPTTAVTVTTGNAMPPAACTGGNRLRPATDVVMTYLRGSHITSHHAHPIFPRYFRPPWERGFLG